MEPNPNQETSPSFFDRQFNQIPTESQLIFDVLIGVILPIICLVIDPFIFRDGSYACTNGISTPQLRIFAYSQIGLGTLTLLLWFTKKQDFDHMAAFFAGIFFAGTISATLLGMLLFPISVSVLRFCVGLLGFTPFVTAFVYFRNGVRAWRTAQQTSLHRSRSILFAFALTAALLVYIIPGIIQQQVWGDTTPALVCYEGSLAADE